MKKITIIGGTTDGGAGSKGLFVLNDKYENIGIVESTDDGGAGSKGQFAIDKEMKEM